MRPTVLREADACVAAIVAVVALNPVALQALTVRAGNEPAGFALSVSRKAAVVIGQINLIANLKNATEDITTVGSVVRPTLSRVARLRQAIAFVGLLEVITLEPLAVSAGNKPAAGVVTRDLAVVIRQDNAIGYHSDSTKNRGGIAGVRPPAAIVEEGGPQQRAALLIEALEPAGESRGHDPAVVHIAVVVRVTLYASLIRSTPEDIASARRKVIPAVLREADACIAAVVAVVALNPVALQALAVRAGNDPTGGAVSGPSEPAVVVGQIDLIANLHAATKNIAVRRRVMGITVGRISLDAAALVGIDVVALEPLPVAARHVPAGVLEPPVIICQVDGAVSCGVTPANNVALVGGVRPPTGVGGRNQRIEAQRSRGSVKPVTLKPALGSVERVPGNKPAGLCGGRAVLVPVVSSVNLVPTRGEGFLRGSGCLRRLGHIRDAAILRHARSGVLIGILLGSVNGFDGVLRIAARWRAGFVLVAGELFPLYDLPLPIICTVYGRIDVRGCGRMELIDANGRTILT